MGNYQFKVKNDSNVEIRLKFKNKAGQTKRVTVQSGKSSELSSIQQDSDVQVRQTEAASAESSITILFSKEASPLEMSFRNKSLPRDTHDEESEN